MTGFLKGTATAMITPFRADGGVDFGSFGAMIEYQIAGGTDMLVILGTTGEPATMTEEEKTAVMEFAVKKSERPDQTCVRLREQLHRTRRGNRQKSGENRRRRTSRRHSLLQQMHAERTHRLLQKYLRSGEPARHRLLRPLPHGRQHSARHHGENRGTPQHGGIERRERKYVPDDGDPAPCPREMRPLFGRRRA